MAHEAPSILISDDNRGFRETLQSMFEPQGFRTLLAEDGEQALDIARRHEVHVVLLDMHMPKLTGLEVLRMVRQFKALLPCILISADLDEDIIRQAQMAQAFSILSKPVSHRLLTGTVERALRWTYNWPGDAEVAEEN